MSAGVCLECGEEAGWAVDRGRWRGKCSEGDMTSGDLDIAEGELSRGLTSGQGTVDRRVEI